MKKERIEENRGMNSDEFVFFSFYRRKNRFSAQIFYLIEENERKNEEFVRKIGRILRKYVEYIRLQQSTIISLRTAKVSFRKLTSALPFFMYIVNFSPAWKRPVKRFLISSIATLLSGIVSGSSWKLYLQKMNFCCFIVIVLI